MKLFLLLLAMGLSPPESNVDRFPLSNSSASGCDPREVSAGILIGSRVPRDIIFHYGKKELLLKDVEAGTIPESDWNDFIMGEKTRFKLKRFRRGFYGTEYVEDADRFGDSTYNWLVEIRLKQECLKPERVMSLISLPQSAAFTKWYESKSNLPSLKEWKNTCFDAAAYPRSRYFIEYKNPSETADFKESICESVVAQYDEEQKFAFVHDYAGDLVRSWAVRDRECIASVEGSDGYWVDAFAARREFWVNTCNRDRNHRNNIRIWFAAIESAGVNAKTMDPFAKMIKEIQPPEDRLDWESQETDRFAAQDFADALVTAVRRCGAGRTKTLQSALGEISAKVDELQSPEVKLTLESLCR